jgi:hypothetical protein
MSDDYLKDDRKALNDTMRNAFQVNRVTGRPGMIRNTLNAAVRGAAGRDLANGTGMTDRALLGPPYEYHLRIPEPLRRDGWWVGSTRVSRDRASYQATIIHDARPEIGRSRTWEPSREEAVDSAVRDLRQTLAG